MEGILGVHWLKGIGKAGGWGKAKQVFVLWATIIKEAQSQNYDSLGDLYIRIYLELALPSIFFRPWWQ